MWKGCIICVSIDVTSRRNSINYPLSACRYQRYYLFAIEMRGRARPLLQNSISSRSDLTIRRAAHNIQNTGESRSEEKRVRLLDEITNIYVTEKSSWPRLTYSLFILMYAYLNHRYDYVTFSFSCNSQILPSSSNISLIQFERRKAMSLRNYRFYIFIYFHLFYFIIILFYIIFYNLYDLVCYEIIDFDF